MKNGTIKSLSLLVNRPTIFAFFFLIYGTKFYWPRTSSAIKEVASTRNSNKQAIELEVFFLPLLASKALKTAG